MQEEESTTQVGVRTQRVEENAAHATFTELRRHAELSLSLSRSPAHSLSLSRKKGPDDLVPPADIALPD